QLLGEADRVQYDPEFQRRKKRLLDFDGIQTRELPRGFEGELRPYQKAGFDWLYFLHDFEFGGCLADDMGLGKTIETLAYLQSQKESGHVHKATLLVLPRSLLVNWQREAEKFTPGLSFYEYFGNQRAEDINAFDNYDLILTTYGVMLRDIEQLREYRFHYAILDESQAIKNPLAKTSKAARLLNADHRLVLTGTPVENSTFELWSQFAYLNPGLLGNLDYFKNEFGNPIERQGDENTSEFLRKMVYPFILRRTKDQVAPELPPRTERVIYADMDPAQLKFYNKTRDYYRAMLLGAIEEKGMNNARMQVLEGLLRLRQICNHPRLVQADFRGDSAKFELLIETIATLQSEGHKALIFSQFVQMLKIVREALDQRKIPYTYLDGRTQNRQERVDTFQNDPKIPFFLISLKAGGVGLNLTAADYVIHIDPWWNPAVEMQATDRTHRIGQDKPVFVYKLITRNSVEEKILQLQDKKKALVEQLISTESSFFKSLTAEDVSVLFS
ncbi:MAG TPA: serine/threonine protein kinase, partial [Chloroflexi bacterium]|nr:serine/threonine protein kinase [Chloroflexota bacterium]